jgi:hypothetical protein
VEKSFRSTLSTDAKSRAGIARAGSGTQTKHHPKTAAVYYEREYDTASLRFLIERFIPAAKTATDLNFNGPEKYLQAIEKAKRDQKALGKNSSTMP